MDDIYAAQQREQEDTTRALSAARMTCAAIPEGEPGECDLCGEWTQHVHPVEISTTSSNGTFWGENFRASLKRCERDKPHPNRWRHMVVV